MKNLILFLFFSFPAFLWAQSNTKVELLGSLDFSNRYILILNSSSSQSSEKGKINTHFGVNYYQKLKPKLWLKIGVGFASLGYKIKKTNLTFADALGTGGISMDPFASKSSQFNYDYHFLEVPFSLHLDFSEKKLQPFVEFGLVPMYYLQTITKHKLDGELHSKDNVHERSINAFQLATKIAFGFNYAFNEKWDVVVQSNFRYHLSEIAKAPVKEYLWSAGLAVGMRMAMK
jgi:hypothetical protein